MGIPYQDGNTRSPPLNPEPHRKAGTFECPETNHGTSRLSAWARKSGLWSQGAIGFEIQERAYSPPNGKPHVRSIQVPLFWTGRNPAEIKGVRMHTRDLDEGLPETIFRTCPTTDPDLVPWLGCSQSLGRFGCEGTYESGSYRMRPVVIVLLDASRE
jgi:hypothetical protein